MMDIVEKLKKTIDDIYSGNTVRVTISKSFQNKEIKKIVIRPIEIKNKKLFQETRYIGTKAFTDNFSKSDIIAKSLVYMQGGFGQLDAALEERNITILTNKKGTITIRSKDAVNEKAKLTHDKVKSYILPDGEPADFLVELGVQLPDGRVTKNRYDKFKQINRYLEFVEDVLAAFEENKTIRIVDFGCGKSYLTFALYYYLKIKKNYNVEIVGLDLKKDVIETCTRLKEKLHYDELRFLQGDIKDYETDNEVDMVVSLHACDTATDYALQKAIEWNAKVIMAVPCCQHEVNRQIRCEELKNVIKYGIIKEKLSSLLTDAYRANMLEEHGYDTQILEFIDMEHTPKNIMLRGIKHSNRKIVSKEKTVSAGTKQMEEFFNISPTLGRILK